ncbi:phosphatase PAP2 family protein [Microbacterium sp. AG238]|uniref:phosphatase PAP2 family protein n=1 Tax=Microbacterium sp. AG238 TaxID=2183994 RepID=UPI000E70CCEB|nr:phosphatase PAP2 family protein [Microbacterium sp. AG238]RKE63049.1 PAP2 superfamily protein [Microbacterium sp. AG238]
MNRNVRYLQLAGVQLVAIAVTILVCVFTATGQHADQAAMVATTASTNPVLRLAQHASANYILIVAALTMILSIVAAVVRRRYAEAVAASVLFVGASVVTQVLKNEVIARPDLASGWGAYGNSLPSGHATIAIAAACAALFASPTRMKWVLAPVLVVWTTVAGMGVIAAGWHRPSDVVTASLVVGFWCTIAALLVAAARRRSGHTAPVLTAAQRRLRGVAPVLIVGAAITAVALCASYASGSGRTLATAVLTAATISATVLGALAVSGGLPSARSRAGSPMPNA